MTHKKLRRSSEDKVFFGVVGGIAEFFNIDATLLRVGWLIITVFSGFVPAIVTYLLAALVMPGPFPRTPEEQKKTPPTA
jgi:phage shock protein C